MGEPQQDHQSDDSTSLDKNRKDSASLDKNHETKTSDVPGENQADGGANDSKQTRSWRFWLTMFALFLGMFVANLDATIIGELADIRVVI
jgi:hypothetical protein